MASLAIARRNAELEVKEDGADDEDEFVRCAETFQPRWQPTLWCSCDRPAGHTGDHFGTPRGGVWSSTMRLG